MERACPKALSRAHAVTSSAHWRRSTLESADFDRAVISKKKHHARTMTSSSARTLAFYVDERADARKNKLEQWFPAFSGYGARPISDFKCLVRDYFACAMFSIAITWLGFFSVPDPNG